MKMYRILHAVSHLCSLIVLGAFCLEFKTFNSPEYFLDTNYLHWTSPLPAISFCQAFPNNSLDSRAEAFLKNLLRPEEVYCKGCDVLKEDEFPEEDYSAIMLKHTLLCQELFSKCFWNGEPIDCCHRVTEVFPGQGKCYTFNAYSLRNELKFSVSHFAKGSVLDVVLTAPVQVFVHDPKDAMFLSKNAPVANHRTRLDVLYSSREVRADQSAWSLTLKQRRCVLQGEQTLANWVAYSETACSMECLIRNQMALCNCSHHLLPNPKNRPICDKNGILCLDKKFSDLHKPKIKKKKTKCKCRPACDEIEVKLIRGFLEKTDSEDVRVRVQQSSPPTERLLLKARVELLDVIAYSSGVTKTSVCNAIEVGVACFSRLFTSVSYLGLVNSFMLRPDRRVLQYYHYRQLLY